MNILVAVDGSDESTAALERALDVADAMGGSVTVAYAVDPSVYDLGGPAPVSGLSDADRRLIMESVEDTERRGIDVLDDAAAFAADRGQPVETELLYGDPVRAITAFAESEGFDAIYVGHRGRSERTERLVGSVAKGIVERTSITVTVVR
ncbi:universal stress protein [Haloplanus rubicundus]|uniref:Universal stress protein n=1 Tax=Haloplanus rubicundus TaxID=1547898 RepID=A0A345E6U5_9EURY|nr:universal stress protein [Haloplanus rubicundus]AXG07917.1 universal stress protein [Haloplanus rubicundus]AXG11332.1 universal stress protein [Haloplanus rubicundus]